VLASTSCCPVSRHELAVVLGVSGPTVLAAASRLVAIHGAVFAAAPLSRKPGYALAMISSVRCAAVITQATTAVRGSSAMSSVHAITVSRDKIHTSERHADACDC
jgi:hypothetical protein